MHLRHLGPRHRRCPERGADRAGALALWRGVPEEPEGRPGEATACSSGAFGRVLGAKVVRCEAATAVAKIETFGEVNRIKMNQVTSMKDGRRCPSCSPGCKRRPGSLTRSNWMSGSWKNHEGAALEQRTAQAICACRADLFDSFQFFSILFNSFLKTCRQVHHRARALLG